MSKLSKLDATIQEKTKVIFRKFPDGEVIALFSELPGDMKVSHCLSYLHIGQHDCADTSIYYDTKPIKFADIEGQNAINFLWRELRSIGYNLTVVSRFSYQMDQKRIAALHPKHEHVWIKFEDCYKCCNCNMIKPLSCGK